MTTAVLKEAVLPRDLYNEAVSNRRKSDLVMVCWRSADTSYTDIGLSLSASCKVGQSVKWRTAKEPLHNWRHTKALSHSRHPHCP
ncbi:hypothetical protein BaRGS_00009478 [Batillaria attramentaria]|uniref:Uncharacterized protein n=1 Tax=Batillaria attramentaria TaxID=370345 RepID=A0ABD0LJD2_9CAEN